MTFPHFKFQRLIAVSALVAGLLGSAVPAAAQFASTGDGTGPTPFIIRGVRIDPTALVPTTEPVRRRGVLLQGEAVHGATASLTAPMRYRAPPLVDETAPIGTVFHRVEFVEPSNESMRIVAVWCSTLGRKTIFGGNSPPICFIEGDLLLRGLLSSEGRGWLVTSGTATSGEVRADRLEFEISETDLIGPMSVRFELSGVRRDRVIIRLIAEWQRQSATVAIFEPAIVDGVAELPLWTHRLRMTVAGDSVTPTLTDDGDRRGPFDR